MSKEKGFVLIFRDIREHWLWTDKPFSKGQAFIDLILRAHHTDENIMFNGKLSELKRGEILTSILKLSEDWGWSRHKVRTFLDLLSAENTITLKTDSKKTVIKVLNYDVYQFSKNAEGQQKDITGTSQGQQKDITGTQSINYKRIRNNYKINTTTGDSDIFISLLLNDGSGFDVTETMVEEWSELYPAVDIKQDLRMMKGWIDSNPSRRKTRAGIKRFITNWLAKTQNSGGNKKQSVQPDYNYGTEGVDYL